MKKRYTKKVRFRDGDGFVHGFSTGKVKVKSGFKTAKCGPIGSKLNFLIDNEWTAYLPILVWVIDHPEGVFVVDTGENERVNEGNYFKKEGALLNYINKSSFEFKVEKKDEIGPQLQELGYTQQDIEKVILTHLHLDHFDGLSYFDSTPIFLSQLEWDKPSFTMPSLYPAWFEPNTIKLDYRRTTLFERISDLNETGEIQLIHTPGHTEGHCSVLVKTQDIHYFLAGDVTYDQNQLENNINAGGHQNFKNSINTYSKVKAYASEYNLVYLPSHDEHSLDRLERDKILSPIF